KRPCRAPSGPDDIAVRINETADIFGLSNGIVFLEINKKSGCITSLRNANNGSSYLAPNACGNQLQTFKDTPKQYDAWNIDPGTLDVPPTLIDKLDSVTLVTDGPLRKTVPVPRTWQSSHLTHAITPHAYADPVRIDNA